MAERSPRFRLDLDGLVTDLVTGSSLGRVEQLTPTRREGHEVVAARWVAISAAGLPISAPTKIRSLAALDVIREHWPEPTLVELEERD